MYSDSSIRDFIVVVVVHEKPIMIPSKKYERPELGSVRVLEQLISAAEASFPQQTRSRVHFAFTSVALE